MDGWTITAIVIDIVFLMLWAYSTFYAPKRLEAVKQFHNRLTDQVSTACRIDIVNARPYAWRWRALEGVPFLPMCWKWWIRDLNDFVTDQRFTDPRYTMSNGTIQPVLPVLPTLQKPTASNLQLLIDQQFDELMKDWRE